MRRGQQLLQLFSTPALHLNRFGRHTTSLEAPRFSTFASYIAPYHTSLLAMAPKQATIGYVKSSQMTLGCAAILFSPHRSRTLRLTTFLSKFFGNPNGSKAPAQQTKLAFSLNSGGQKKEKVVAKEEEDDGDGNAEANGVEQAEMDVDDEVKRTLLPSSRSLHSLSLALFVLLLTIV